jgi:hypothetical protein
VLQAEHQRFACHRLFDRLDVHVELITDRRADEAGTILVEALLHQQIDLSQMHRRHIDGDLSSSVVAISLW